MRISTTHRSLTKPYAPTVYRELATRCAAALGACGGVTSVVACGSLVKDDIVPGWSDLDLVTFVDAVEPTEVLKAIRMALRTASDGVSIGIGMDVVPTRAFLETGRLGGRPLAMSYEISRYAEKYWGADVLGRLPALTEPVAAHIREESALLQRAELHNWTREFVLGPDRELEPLGWLATCVKTALKLLKHEVEPDTHSPFTHASYLEAFRSHRPSAAGEDLYRWAVEARATWTSVALDVNHIALGTSFVESNLARLATTSPGEQSK